MAGSSVALSHDLGEGGAQERWLTLVPEPLPEPSLDQARRLAHASARPFSLPSGEQGIF